MRKRRIITETGVYHIYQQANSRIIIFYDNEDKETFLKCVARSAKIFSVEVYAYVIMDNHWHLLVKTNHLSDFVSNYMVSYVKWYNYKHKKAGNLCNGPFSSSPKNNLNNILNCIKYILNNPVKSNIVNYSCNYIWSSANQYYEDIINSKSSLRINDSIVKSYFSSKKEFEIFINTPNGELDDFKEEKDFCIKITNSQLAEKLNSILKGRSIYELTLEEIKNYIILFASETKASYIQLSNLFQVSYTFVRDTIHHR